MYLSENGERALCLAFTIGALSMRNSAMRFLTMYPLSHQAGGES